MTMSLPEAEEVSDFLLAGLGGYVFDVDSVRHLVIQAGFIGCFSCEVCVCVGATSANFELKKCKVS